MFVDPVKYLLDSGLQAAIPSGGLKALPKYDSQESG
jgi:hypothetical protein